ncbi:MAG: DUF4357 domain-containing protein [Clostridia bacterium]
MNFYLDSKKNNFKATLEVTKDGKYVLKKGSTVNRKISMSFKSYKTVLKRRDEYGLNEKNNVLNKDIKFNSSSVAGEFVTGSSCNGPSSWKNEKGMKLKEWLLK